jgi:diguanylate cyclase (GGDEF)-like protein
MLERARSLEGSRTRQIAQASEEFANLARHSAEAQLEVIKSVETILKSSAYIRASAGGMARSCDMMRASLPANLPWIRTLLIVGGNDRVQCSTNNDYVGLDLSDRAYMQKTRETRDLVLSDFLFAKPSNSPMVMAAYPVSAIKTEADSVSLDAVSLDWMSKILGNLRGRPGVSAALIDSTGTIMATPADQASMIGRPLDNVPLLSAIAEKALSSDAPDGSSAFSGTDGSRRGLSFVRIPGTESRLIVSIDEAKVTAAINREIRTAYLQLCFVCLFVPLGALIAAEKLIINPIEVMTGMARRFGAGDSSARLSRSRLPAEFMPLARAFNAMAAQLSQRERELVATNDRLTVMASIDMLSGLANRRGFQSRLDFEWLKAPQYNSKLSLLMIDVDHFKLYNDSYGHPEGDACLTKLGKTLAGIAAGTMGFAGRYGGEEFCLLLPNTGPVKALDVGETVRAAIQALGLPHVTSGHQIVSVGVAVTLPNESQRPGDLIEAADAALYAAKHRGRNNVVEHGFARLVDEAGMALAG